MGLYGWPLMETTIMPERLFAALRVSDVEGSSGRRKP